MESIPEILLVEDERVVRKSFRALFEAEGLSVREARNGAEGVAAFSERSPDLVLLDVMMPKMNGLQACEAIRAQDACVPILFLTSVPSETTQLRAYGVGADDYIDKSLNPDLIVAKVRAVLRRQQAQVEADWARDRICLGPVSVDLLSLEVVALDGSRGHLTKTEGDILRVLDARRGETVSADELIAALRGVGYVCEDAMIYVHISNLRRKLGPAASRLACTRGVGYALRS